MSVRPGKTETNSGVVFGLLRVLFGAALPDMAYNALVLLAFAAVGIAAILWFRLQILKIAAKEQMMRNARRSLQNIDASFATLLRLTVTMPSSEFEQKCEALSKMRDEFSKKY